MHILSVAEMKAVEAAADAADHSYMQMMMLAGQGVARALLKRQPVKGRRALVLVGPGNNGGDGLVVARYLADAGATVTAYLSRPRSAEEDHVYQRAVDRGVAIVNADNDPDRAELRRLTLQADVLIDALLGTGATPPLQGVIAELLAQVRAALQARPAEPLLVLNGIPEMPIPRPYIVAVDGPSGLDFDTGALDPLALPAHLTVTFAAPKSGHFRFPGAAALGELVVADIGIPAGVAPEGSGPLLVTSSQVRQWLPSRPLDAHKGTFGRALIVAGSANYTGAAALAAQAAVRAGAGLVTLAVAGALHAAIVPLVPEATYLLLPHALGALTADAVPLLRERLADYTALLVGPGLGQAEETAAFLEALLGRRRTERRGFGFATNAAANGAAPEPPPFPPLVMDADGLNLLSQLPEWFRLLPPETILTPHPGEMARLCQRPVAEIQGDRLKTAQEQAQTWGHVVVLKGAFTVIAAPDGRVALIPFANPGLATAGTGDVLAGAIVALRAQGLGAFEAAAAGAYLHGLAGALARQQSGAAGMAAGDLLRSLPEAWKQLE